MRGWPRTWHRTSGTIDVTTADDLWSDVLAAWPPERVRQTGVAARQHSTYTERVSIIITTISATGFMIMARMGRSFFESLMATQRLELAK